MKVAISEIKKDEIPQCAAIIRDSFRTIADEFGLTKENCPSNGAFLEDGRLLSEHERGVGMFGIYEDKTQAGFMALERKDNGLFYIEKLAVLPEYRHRGYGGMLMEHAKEYVKSSGGGSISAGIIYENKRLLKWYEKYGFTVTGIRRFDHLPFTVCFMELKV